MDKCNAVVIEREIIENLELSDIRPLDAVLN
jgi:hypothetical protein